MSNMATKSAYTRNRVRSSRKQLLFELCLRIGEIHNESSLLNCDYVKSADNGADYFSRLDFKQFLKKSNNKTNLKELRNINRFEDI